MVGLALDLILITRQKARALAEQGATGQVVAEIGLPCRSISFSWPSPSPPQPKKSLAKSLKKLLSPSQAAMLTPLGFLP